MASVQDSSASRLFWLIVLSAVFPPAAVIIEFGFFTWKTLISFLLTFLFFFAGFIHAAYLLTQARYNRLESADYESVPEGPAEPASQDDEQSHDHIEHHHVDTPAEQPESAQPSQSANPPPYSDHPEQTTMDNKIQHGN